MVSFVDQFMIEFFFKCKVNCSSRTIFKIGYILYKLKGVKALKDVNSLFISAQRESIFRVRPGEFLF